MSQPKLMFAGLGLVGLLAAPAFAQDSNTPGSTSVASNDPAAAEREARLQAIAADRDGATAAVVSRWRGGEELRAALARLDDAGILSAQDAKTPAELNGVLFKGREVGPLAGIGDGSTHLVFFPLTPCRIIDTRVAGGQIAGGTFRDFDSQAPYTAQGGQAASCGVPGFDVAALAITLTAVNPAGSGDLRAWPSGAPVPNASVVNFALPGTGLNLANTTILPLTQDALQTFEFSIQADTSAVHVVADVVGYFDAGNAPNVAEGLNAGPVDLTGGTCLQLTTCTVTNPNSFARNAYALGTTSLRVNHVVGSHDETVVNVSSSATPVCPGFPYPAGTGRYDINNNHPTGCCMEGTVTVGKAFSVPANSSLTIRLFGQQNLMSAGLHEVTSATLQCFLP